MNCLTHQIVVDAARSAYAAGLNVLPVATDGTKRPAVPQWGRFKATRPSPTEMQGWQWNRQQGFGVVAGAVSGHIESWDFDDLATFDAFCESAKAIGLGAVVDRLLEGYSDSTPRDGRRILVRYPITIEWQDVTLARRPSANGKTETLIELPTFAIIAPSNGQTHPSGKPYCRLAGDFSTIASYSGAEREALIQLARSFDEMPARENRTAHTKAETGSRPGDRFAAATTWAAILEPHGWLAIHSRKPVTYWRRPDKSIGCSATTNHGGSDLLYVFSSSTPFDPERSYTKFAAYAVLEHGGDFRATARALVAKGFGEPPKASVYNRPAREVQADSAPILTRLSDVAPEPIDWLWTQRLARGKKTLIAGDPGQGKSSITYDLAARITRGTNWPDGERAFPGDVLFLCAEDGLADTVRPKIDRCGGDASRVFVLEGVKDRAGARMVNLARDLAAIESAIGEVSPDLVVIDPITAYLGRTDSYKDAEVRALLAPLLALLVKHRCALLTVAHLSKDQQRAALHRPGGSIAFVAAARLAFAVAADPNDDERRILAPLKANICQKAPSLAFRLPDGRVAWESGPVSLDADTLLRPAQPGGDRAEHVDAETFLRDYLGDGSKDSTDILKAAESNGISRSTLFRVKARIGVRAFRTGGVGSAGKWAWTLTVSREPSAVSVPEPDTLRTLSDLRPVSVSGDSKRINAVALEDDDAERL